MATQASYKALALASDLKDRLARLFTSVSAISFDAADGTPYFTVSAETDGSTATTKQAALIRIQSIVPGGVDGLGLSPRAFSPHKAVIVGELSATAGVLVLNAANLLKVIGTVEHSGLEIDLSNTANGTACTGTIAASLATFDPELKWRTLSSI